MKAPTTHLVIGFVLILVTLCTVSLTMDWGSGLNPATMIGFTIWPAVPLVTALIAGWLLRASRPALMSCTLGLLVTFGVMAFFYVYAFFINPDPQGGLIIIFGPIYALAGLIPFGIAAIVLFFRRQRAE